ncbi:Fungalysin metallopeptidase-domain-containing protein [Desarmillaria tabescens]|uniref:Extracellular metalloproteinase n=1 Tax=Armillaria tabescens TaxID=1929756 RepID=A0AA39NB36_ARMTA|nr:Fungalysin metallopeptidase-domain-containing protein [Desarmillaria tabescens]KAK0462289.1 Fungalysin metallopeptidase-domain-containing protein [Desarmillaria tabescens]
MFFFIVLDTPSLHLLVPRLILARCEDRGEIGGGDKEGVCDEEEVDGEVMAGARRGIGSGDNGVVVTEARLGRAMGNRWRVPGYGQRKATTHWLWLTGIPCVGILVYSETTGAVEALMTDLADEDSRAEAIGIETISLGPRGTARYKYAQPALECMWYRIDRTVLNANVGIMQLQRTQDHVFSNGWTRSSVVQNMNYSYAKQYREFLFDISQFNLANAMFRVGKAIIFDSSFSNTFSSPITLFNLIVKVQDTLLETQCVTSLKYLTQSDGSVSSFKSKITTAMRGTTTFVDAHSGEILSVTDFVAQETDTITEGKDTLVDPEDHISPSSSWIQDNQTAEAFDYHYDTTLCPTNTFYIISKDHDYIYKYGWTEMSYNLQSKSFVKGGAEGDRVLISVHDSSEMNNTNFATPPDGQSGTCRMYIWTLTTPQRNGALRNDIIVHEFMHGITNLPHWWRMTEHKDATVPDYVLASWVFNNPAGIRTHPYSTNASVNPLRYSSIQNLHEVHDIGEVWANMLHNVYAALVQAHGFSTTAMDDLSGLEGNIVWLHLFIDTHFLCSRVTLPVSTGYKRVGFS